MHYDVDALFNRIDHAGSQFNFNLNSRVAAHELPHYAAQKQLTKLNRRAHPQQTGRLTLQLHDRLFGLGKLLHYLPTTLVISLPNLG